MLDNFAGFSALFDEVLRKFPVLLDSTLETFYMVAISGLLGAVIGVPLGIFLATSAEGELFASPAINRIFGFISNVIRSLPYLILSIYLIPLTTMLVGGFIGTKGAIVTLTIAVAPFIARVTESSIREVDQGLSEAARAYGATPWQIVTKVLLPEALPGLILGATLSIISLIGYSAVVGLVGGGGLGALAQNYGLNRWDWVIMNGVAIILVVVVQCLQSYGDRLSRRFNRRVRGT